jgi:hypothetical protein
LHGGRLAGVDIASTRPDVAAAMLQGRSRSAVAAALPLLYSVCARSQSVAGELAWAVAVGEPIDGEALARCDEAVSSEMVRESASRVLLEWPRWLGETPDSAAIAAARSAFALPSDAGRAARAESIARASLGCSAGEWIDRCTLAEFDRWLDAGTTVSARFLRRERDADATAPSHRLPDVALLDGDALAAGTATRQAADLPAAGASPDWHGLPAETGAVARLRAEPLIAAIAGRSVTRVPARFAARLLELARLIDGRQRARLGTWTLPSGGAVAWVENARGLLLHEVQVADGAARVYRIVAPTDWNFHPQGALFAALADAPGDDPVAVEHQARQVIRSLDPCVECCIEVHRA